MKVKELIEKLEKMDKEKEVIIKFAVSPKDEVGYILTPNIVESFIDEAVIYAIYPTNENHDYEVIGQYDLQELWEEENYNHIPRID